MSWLLLAPGLLLIVKVWRDTAAYNRVTRSEREAFERNIDLYRSGGLRR